MAKRKLTAIPTRRAPEAPPADPGADGTPAGPNLDHIDPDLRALAVECSSISFDPANTRVHDEANLSAIRGSFRRFGQTKPLVVRKSNRIVAAGNGGLAVALSLGWTHVAVSFKEMDDVTAAAYSIADNRSSDLSTWDDDKLNAMLKALPSTIVDPDLDRMLQALREEHAAPAALPEAGEGGDEFDVDAAAEGECRVKPGDVWVIGGYVARCPKCSKMTKVPSPAPAEATA